MAANPDSRPIDELQLLKAAFETKRQLKILVNDFSEAHWVLVATHMNKVEQQEDQKPYPHKVLKTHLEKLRERFEGGLEAKSPHWRWFFKAFAETIEDIRAAEAAAAAAASATAAAAAALEDEAEEVIQPEEAEAVAAAAVGHQDPPLDEVTEEVAEAFNEPGKEEGEGDEAKEKPEQEEGEGDESKEEGEGGEPKGTFERGSASSSKAPKELQREEIPVGMNREGQVEENVEAPASPAASVEPAGKGCCAEALRGKK